MPRQTGASTRSMHPGNMLINRGSSSNRSRIRNRKAVHQMKPRKVKKAAKAGDYMFEDEIIVCPPPRSSRDLRFTIPDVPANRDLLNFINTRAHDIMGEVVRELTTTVKIMVSETRLRNHNYALFTCT